MATAASRGDANSLGGDAGNLHHIIFGMSWRSSKAYCTSSYRASFGFDMWQFHSRIFGIAFILKLKYY